MSLADSVTDIVHCAADVRFNRTLDEARSVNTAGTKMKLDLAADPNASDVSPISAQPM